MKKSLLFVAALLMSAMTFAADNTSTWNIANAEAAGIAKGKYGNLKDVEATITLDGVIYLAQDIMRPNNNTPEGFMGDQVLQLKKKTGHFMNKTEMELVSLEIIVNDENVFEVATGVDVENLAPVTLTAADQVISLITATKQGTKYVEGDPADLTYRKATIDLTGKKFVKVTGLEVEEKPTPLMYQAVLTYKGKGGEVTYVDAVALNVADTTVSVYATVQLQATVTPDNADNKAVTWASSDEKVATVSENGLVTALAVGTANIVATAADGSEKSATCKVTVEAAKQSDFGLIKAADLKDNDTVIITMTVDSVGVPMVMDASEAKGAPGPKAIAGGIIEGTIVPALDAVTFVAHIDEKGIMFVPKGKELLDSVALFIGSNANDGVRIKKYAKDDNVKWNVDAETGYLKITNIVKEEEVTRYLGENGGAFKAYQLTKGKLSNMIKDQTLKFFVKGAEPLQPVAVADVALNTAEEQLEVGKTFQLVATVSPEDAENKAVTWASADASIASVDANGLVTAVAKGETTITVTTVDGGKTASAKIVVVEPQAIENVTVDAAAVKVMHEGQIFILREGKVYTIQGVQVK